MRLALAFIVALAGCASSQSLTENDRSRLVSAAPDDAFTEALVYLTSEGWPVATLEREAGVITTDWRPVSGAAAALGNVRRQRLTIALRPEGDGTRVVLTLSDEQSKSGGAYAATTSTSDYFRRQYRLILDGLQAALEA